jgi:hypothetical protein
MVTNKRRIQGYIPDYLYNSLKDFCDLHALSVSSGLEELLTIALSKRSSDELSSQLMKVFNKNSKHYYQMRYLSERVERIENFLSINSYSKHSH